MAVKFDPLEKQTIFRGYTYEVGKNGNITPSSFTSGSKHKVWWKCSLGHQWQAAIYNRAKPNGTGCPICSKASRRIGL